MVDFRLHLIQSLHKILLMDRMGGSLLDDLLHDCSQSEALIMIGLDLLLELLRACAFDVLSENLQLLVTLQNLIFELPDLLLERHYKEGLLLVFLGRLG